MATLSSGAKVRIEVASSDFFVTPLKKLTVEHNDGTGRTYILKGDRIVAVAVAKDGHQ